MDENRIYEKLVGVLRRMGWHVATMESCTGGCIASCITDISGASEVFDGGVVTYSNAAKIRAGVSPQIIEQYGVYSPETAAAMAFAVRRAHGAAIGIGVTGTLGRIDPNNADSVPGEVHFAIAMEGNTVTETLTLTTSCRHEGKRQVARAVALRLLAETATVRAAEMRD